MNLLFRCVVFTHFLRALTRKPATFTVMLDDSRVVREVQSRRRKKKKKRLLTSVEIYIYIYVIHGCKLGGFRGWGGPRFLLKKR